MARSSIPSSTQQGSTSASATSAAPLLSTADSSSAAVKAGPVADSRITELRLPSNVTAAQRLSRPTTVASGAPSATAIRPSTSRSFGRARRSATGYGTAQYPALRHNAAAASSESGSV